MASPPAWTNSAGILSTHFYTEGNKFSNCFKRGVFQTFTKWEISLFMLSKCIIWGTRNAKFEVESLFTEHTCVIFVPKGSTKKVS